MVNGKKPSYISVVHDDLDEDGDTLKLPFASKKDLDMWVKKDELIIQYKNFKRNVTLPRALASLELQDVELKDKILKVRFGGPS